ncbi:transporter substrate-binding domain-containing protein [Solirubrobacter phytolaccae]|uniref:Transporter substrate-binding domain-containing protein n=1 Tax=Solirubrobacter phytolaccae TaxID=1404360 RepID=A0A9X3NDV8_9ACTN|nr:transporter substrate-binding domain-containing protein [Solirubrobacter phytolaccae]MDA0184261.1 transporter substrate-binding domain-containing protein [Solirubrobacter phytolaccae]
MRFAWIDERPFNYEGPNGLTGCDVELAKAAFAAAGFTFEPVHTTFQELLPGLLDGRWDVTTGMFITDERQTQARFTRPIWTLRDGLLVRRECVEVDGCAALAREGLTLAVLGGQVQADHARRLGVAPGALVEFDTYPDAAAAVLDGRVDAYASVALAHRQHLSLLGGELRCVTVPDGEVPPALGAFACASDEVRAALDGPLEGLLGPGVPGEPAA